MRSFIPRILISIIAFALGSASALLWNAGSTPAPTWNFPLTIKSDPPDAAPPPVPFFSRDSGPPVSTVNRPARFKCRNRLFSFLLGHLRKNEPDLDVDGFIEASEIEDCSVLFQIERKVDLNGDGRNEIIVRTRNNPKSNFFCGMTGNCQTWAIREEKGKYKIVFNAGVVEEIEVRDNKKGSYNDLTTRYHGGTMEHTLASYKYRNGKYLLEKCTKDILTIDGKRHLLRTKLSHCRF